MAKQRTAAQWFDQIKAAEEDKNAFVDRDLLTRLKRYYCHEVDNTMLPNFNLIFMMGSSMMPNMVFNSPHVTNTASRPDFNTWARFFDAVDNWTVKEMRTQEKLEEAVLHAYLQNTVAIQVCYDFDTRPADNPGQIFDKLPFTADRSRKYNFPWLDIIPASSFLVPAGTLNSYNCPWFAKYVLLPVRKVKATPGVISSKVEATKVLKEPDRPIQRKFRHTKSEPKGWVGFWEIRCAETGEYGWLDEVGTIIKPFIKDDTQVDGLAVEFLTFNPAPDNIWGTPDGAYIESQHIEGNEIRRDARKQRRVALVKFLFDSALLDADQVDKFMSGDPKAAIPVKLPIDKKLQDCIAMVQPHVQRELEQEMKNEMNDAQLLLGIGSNQLGQFAPGRRSKFEAQVVEERNLLRTGRRRQRLADIIGSHMSRINSLYTENWHTEVVFKVMGVEGALHWVKANPIEFSEASANLVTSISVESLAPVSRDRRREEMLKVIEVLAKLQGAQDPRIDSIVASLLSSFDWQEVQKRLPTANPNQVQSAGAFQQQQQQAAQDPGTSQQLGQNLQNLLPLTTGG